MPAAFEALHTYSPESDLVTATSSSRATPLAKLKLHLSEALISLPAFSHWIRIGCDPWTWQLSCRVSPSAAAAGWRGWSKTGGFVGSGIWKCLREYSRKESMIKNLREKEIVWFLRWQWQGMKEYKQKCENVNHSFRKWNQQQESMFSMQMCKKYLLSTQHGHTHAKNSIRTKALLLGCKTI